MLTSCGKPFSTEKKLFFSSARPPEVRHLTFLFYSLNLLHKVTHIFWTLACWVALSAYAALILSSYSSSQDFATHFLHFHLTMDSLCFANGWLICTPITDFHRQAKCHARHTQKKDAIRHPLTLAYIWWNLAAPWQQFCFRQNMYIFKQPYQIIINF